MIDKNDKKTKVPYYLIAGEEPTEIELTNGGADGYKGKWWETFPESKDYGTTHPRVDVQQGEFNRSSSSTGALMQWFDHHSQAYNDHRSNRTHPQRHSDEKD